MECVSCNLTPRVALVCSAHSDCGAIYCSDECADRNWQQHFEAMRIGPGVKREREEDEEDLYMELLQLLVNARAGIQHLDGRRQDVGMSITDSLLRHGAALVRVPNDTGLQIEQATGRNMADTFTMLQPAAKNELRLGRFEVFSRDFQEYKFSEHEIALKNVGMPNKPPLPKSMWQHYTHPLTATVHRPNQLAARNNLEMWDILTHIQPELHPRAWFRGALLQGQDYRNNVSEDAIKILRRKTYNPTGLHYDGQLGQMHGVASQRTQIVYTNDQGPVRLFIVPGTHSDRAKDIITKLTGRPYQSGFEAKAVPERLKDMLIAHGVALPERGLLMFLANVWHFEAVKADNLLTPNGLLTVDTVKTLTTKSFTRASSPFRIYCGVISVPPGPLIKDLIVVAFLREHGWIMSPFARSINQKSDLFVNEKGTQSWPKTAMQMGSEDEWQRLKTTDINEMKRYLLDNVSQARLYLYGLTRTDLEPPARAIIDLTGE